MAVPAEGGVVKEDAINALSREAEELKIKLAEERQKQNDVERKFCVHELCFRDIR